MYAVTVSGVTRRPLRLNAQRGFPAGRVRGGRSRCHQFETLVGVFASAMTGNFALLAYYVAQSDSQAAMGSVVALSGFVVGCAIGILQRRGRAQVQAISLLLASETKFAVVLRALRHVDPARLACSLG
jgi:uncharacterized membrane protein YoaK (UPF0700 family)